MIATAPDEALLAFAAALRAAGVAVTPDRGQQFLRAAALAGADRHEGLYWSGRATLCAGTDDIDRYDLVFAAWFGGEPSAGTVARSKPRTVRQPELAPAADAVGGDRAGLDDLRLRAVASGVEVLRHRDIAELDPAERRRLDQLLDQLEVRPPQRTSPRRQPSRRGTVDGRRTLRDQLRRAGEAGPLTYRRRGTRRRHVVLLLDVSGSMEPYADHLLRLAHRIVRGAPTTTEVLTMGTRLTRVTAALRARESTSALAAAGRTVPDWSGGTRLGEVLKVFLDRHGQRGMARGAVVVVFSDGWERGDTALLAEQALRLRRLAHRLVWVNPHRGKPGYLPVQGGIVAVAPAIDDLLAGHSLATFEELVGVIASA
ncbi:MAG: VWA domain-containing protein [Nocardioidaceae bacterium]|nr:VWA domain-containing protein [Nocardioidaceae bacterium]